jgi:MFS transporter, DHA2 family, multidrug resistance protein
MTPNRGAITVCIILATLMQALDTTIANVALPYVQGSVAASQDQITWVLTSYIVAAAIMTPPTGFLAGRFGIKRLFLISVAGFTGASMLCGMAQSLPQIVVFRILQGLFGAALVPLSQTVLFDIYPREQQGSAMAMWGVAVMAGPVLGPVIGGWLTQYYTWRYVFYINLPIGLLAFIGLSTFLPDTRSRSDARLDWIGFGSLSVAVGALQIMLDRGEQLDWFSSGEIVTELIVTVCAVYIFLVHTFTVPRPFVNPSLFRDRNYTAGVLFVFIVGMTFFAALALQPPYLQNLMNYPVVTAGLVMGPRGIGTMAAMLVVGKLIGRVDVRVLLSTGLLVSAWSFYSMTGWTPDVAAQTIIFVGIIQGISLGFLFTPLSVVTLSTLPAETRTEGAGIYSLSRNIGSSIGISVVTTLLTRNTQASHADISQYVTPTNRILAESGAAQFLDPTNAGGRALLDSLVTVQARIIAYIDDYKFLMLATLVVIPLVAVFKRPARGSAGQQPVVVE